MVNGTAPGRIADRPLRAVVTGGAGFIGSHLTDALLSDGTDVLVIDDLSSGRLSNLEDALRKNCHIERVDITDGARLLQVFRAFRPEVVFHLAAQMDVRHSMTDPARDALTNVVGSINVFAAAHDVAARRIVNTSTGGAIYGESVPVPTPESAPRDPASAYGLSKRTVEEYAAWFRRSRGVDVVTLRYGNVYGPRQDPHGDAGVIALFCGCASRGQRPTVYGDGSQTRDYAYVDDIVAANVLTARRPSLSFAEYNIGSGQEISVLQLLDAVTAVAGIDAADFVPHFAPARAGELSRSCLDTARARQDLRTPPPTDLTTGLRRTVSWVRTVEGLESPAGCADIGHGLPTSHTCVE